MTRSSGCRQRYRPGRDSCKAPPGTLFSLDTFSDAKFVVSTGVSIVTLLLTTVFGPLEAFLKTTALDVRQWLICLAVSLPIVVVTEIRKAVPRRMAAEAVPAKPSMPFPAAAGS